MRRLGSVYYSDSSLASPILPSLSPAPHAGVLHTSLGQSQGLAGNACFTAKHTCFLQPAKPFSCWLLGWMIISLQTPCLHSFLMEERIPSLSLSLSFSLSLSLSLSLSIPLSPLPTPFFLSPSLLPFSLSFQLDFVLILQR